MFDIEDAHAIKAAEIIKAFHAKAAAIMTESARLLDAQTDALRVAHSDFITDIGILSSATEAQMRERLATTIAQGKAAMDHFAGVLPVKEMVPRAPQTSEEAPPTAPSDAELSASGMPSAVADAKGLAG